MPKKPNFLGGQQNYNKSTGEYEPNLVGPNGKVVTDADGDGISHESLKYDHELAKKSKKAGFDVASEEETRDVFERKEHDFNKPSERESLKAEEREFNVPYHEGTKGKLVEENGDMQTLEYTTNKGITRKDQFYKDEVEKANPKDNKSSDSKSSRVPWSDKYSDDPTEWYFESYKDIEERILNGEIPVEFKDGEIDTNKLYEQIKGEYSDQLEDGTLEDMVYDATMDIDEKSYNKERKYRQSQSNKSEVEKANQIPEDVVKGFKDLGYNDEDIQKQFEFHKKDLVDPDDPDYKVTDEDTYEYMRSHLEDGGILPKKEEPAKKPASDTFSKDLKSSYNHFVSDLGREPTVDDIAEDLLDNYSAYKDVDVGGPEAYRSWYNAVQEEFNRQGYGKSEFLSKEHLDQLYEQAGGDEDEITDLIRASKEYKTSEMTNSDLQGVVEAYMDKKTGKDIVTRYREKREANRRNEELKKQLFNRSSGRIYQRELNELKEKGYSEEQALKKMARKQMGDPEEYLADTEEAEEKRIIQRIKDYIKLA